MVTVTCFIYLLIATALASGAKEGRSTFKAILFGLSWPYLIYLRIKNK